MRDTALLGLRVTLGGYLATHGAQKLFGAFGGAGLDTTAAAFDRLGLRPGRAMAGLAGGAEFAGGLLTLAGLADPVGPVAIAGAMAVASTVHGDKGPLGAKGGYELPLTNLAAAMALAGTGPGRYRLDAVHGRRMPRPMVRLTIAGTAALSAYSVVGVVRTRRQRAAVGPEATPSAPAETSSTAAADRAAADSEAEAHRSGTKSA